jgi:glycosyltransferase involved in cell wall biosynthesis
MTPDITLVIPTFNERDAVVPLLTQIDAALRGIAWDALFVDDSTDGTDEVLAVRGRADARVHVLHRTENRGGLAGAVVEGLRHARGAYVCVLDADLQHPPERISALLEKAIHTGADIVVASRYVPGGSAGGLDGPLRRFYSQGLRQLTRMVFPLLLANVTDPLGGYFLVRRTLVEDVELRPIGYKILLEILVRCGWQTEAEVPYRFEPRLYGASKADFRQGMRFLHHLARLAWDCSPSLALARLLFPPRPSRATRPARV